MHPGVPVLVTINTRGEVIDAAVADDNLFKLDPAPAIAAARSWRFRPQQFDGAPIEAVGRIQIDYAVPPIAPKPIPFPAVDPNKVVVTLKRGACFGSCPDYSVSVSGAGVVHFSTDENAIPGASVVHRRFNGNGVLWPGVHTAQIDPAVAKQLIERFRQISFFGLKDAYICPATDLSATQLTFVAPGLKKQVFDYFGECVGMPHDVVELENEIDRIAGTARWVSGTPETLDLLEKDGLVIRSPVGANFTAAVALKLSTFGDASTPNPATEKLLEILIDRGVPLSEDVHFPLLWRDDRNRRSSSETALGVWLLNQVIQAHSIKLFVKLADHGVLRRAGRDALTMILHSGAGCSPKVARALVEAGAEPRHPPERSSGLTAIRSSYGVCGERSEDEVATTALTLLDLGVPTEALDENGWTALMGVDSPALAKLLLDHHADPNAHDKDGATPLLTTVDDRVALLLLRAGADPRARDAEGTIREQAIKRHMPATLSWLDAHEIP